MTMLRPVFAITALLLVAAASPPRPAAPGTSNARAGEGEAVETLNLGDEKVICRREKATGSRVTAKRVCMTARQWEAQRMEDRQRIEQGQAQRTRSDQGG